MNLTRSKIVAFHLLMLFSCGRSKTEHRIDYYDKEMKVKKSDYSYVNDMRNGESLEYYPGGQLKEKTYFKNDVIEGKGFGYREDGSLAVINYFDNGQLFRFESYYPSGKIKTISIYDSKMTVISKMEFYETGKLKPIKLTVYGSYFGKPSVDSLDFKCRIDNVDKNYFRSVLINMMQKRSNQNNFDTLKIINDSTNLFLFSLPKSAVISDSLFFDFKIDYKGDSSVLYSSVVSVKDLFPK